MTPPDVSVPVLHYYLLINCPLCDEEVYYGLCATLLYRHGRPVIPADVGEQLTLECDAGHEFYTGELEVEYDPDTVDDDPDVDDD